MSGNQGNGDTFEEKIYKMIVDDEKCDEFGFPEFLNPCVQAPIERAAQEYKKKYNLKKAYDGQEMLRKMRADIKREYLTRKKQLKTLQRDAAVTFREAETTLQEHYSKIFAKTQGRRAIDITLPLVSEVLLPHGKIDLKQFNCEQEFESYRRFHVECYQIEREGAIEFMRKSDGYHHQKQGEQEESDRQQQQSSCANHYKDPRDDCGDGCGDLHCQVCSFVREQYEEWRQQQRECGDGDDDSDSYDSSYCAEFGYYPREYNYEREIREAEEAREAAAAEQQRREENMRDVDGELGGEEEPREIPWDEWVAGGHVSEKCLGCEDLECSDCYSYGNKSDGDSYDSSYCADFGYPRVYNYERECREREEAARAARAARAALAQEEAEEAEAEAEAARKKRWEEMSPEEEERLWSENTRNSNGELWDEEAIADEAEHRREVALMKLNDDMTYECDDDHDHPEVVAVTASTASTSRDICARKKAASKSHAAAAAKARIAKQQLKKGKKFVPLQITINDNRERHSKNQEQQATAIISASKLEINLPKKNLQGASREAKKCHNKKWKSANALAKQSGARETRLTYLPGAITHECMEYDSSDCYFDY